MKALITGVAGFIGSHLAERLLADGWVVIGIDNFDPFYSPQLKRRNLATVLQSRSFRLIEADIRNAAEMQNACSARPDVIIHLAAKAGVRPSIAEPLLYADVNVNGTVNLLQAARHNEVPKFIFGSSSSVYGNNQKVPFSEHDNVDFPISPYAATKKAGELLCHTYHHLYGISITCLRFFTVYGPRQRPDLAVHKFTRLIEKGQPIPVYGDGSMMRDFTYIDDIIDGIVAAIHNCSSFDLYNLGNAHPISVNDLIDKLETALGKKAVRHYLPPQPGDVQRTYADITKASSQLGYQPRTSIEQGLERFVQWFRQQSVP